MEQALRFNIIVFPLKKPDLLLKSGLFTTKNSHYYCHKLFHHCPIDDFLEFPCIGVIAGH